MFGFNCIGFGIENAGWNPYWMYPGPCFGMMGFGRCGYNPRLSDGIMLGQSIMSGLNGIFAGVSAHYNYGLNGFDAARVAFGTAAAGTNNALFGNLIDKGTGTYAGSVMSSTFNNFMNPFATPFGMPYGMGYNIGLCCYC